MKKVRIALIFACVIVFVLAGCNAAPESYYHPVVQASTNAPTAFLLMGT